MFALNPREHITKEKVLPRCFPAVYSHPGALPTPASVRRVLLQQVVDSVLEIFKERSNIAASLSNTESMMDSLHAGLAGALHFLFIGFYLVIW